MPQALRTIPRFWYVTVSNFRHETNSHPEVAVLFVGNMIRYLVSRALQLPPETWKRIAVWNASITVLEIYSNGRVSLRFFSDVGHLPTFLVTYGWMNRLAAHSFHRRYRCSESWNYLSVLLCWISCAYIIGFASLLKLNMEKDCYKRGILLLDPTKLVYYYYEDMNWTVEPTTSATLSPIHVTCFPGLHA